MSEQFIIAFGGTGARCLEAFLYLAASRCHRGDVHAMVIDPDSSNGNVSLTRSQAERFQAVEKTLRPSAGRGGSFFSLGLNQGESASSFFWEYPNRFQPFGTLIGFHQQPESHQGLLELLFDRDDLSLSFEKGYRGRAHVGSLDLLRTLRGALTEVAEEIREDEESEEGDEHSESDALRVFFRRLRSAAQGGTARLFVFGSVFGGTGASGLPCLPPLVSSSFPQVCGNIEIGCAQMLPYFSFPKGGEKDPNSALHPLATQASLFHYSHAKAGYNRIYLVGAPQRIETNKANLPGGSEQRNSAHYAELGAALSALDFLDGEVTKGTSDVFSTGVTSLDWDDFPGGKSIAMRKNLISFATLSLFHAHFLYDDLRNGRHRGTPWAEDLSIGLDRPLGGQEDELKDLNEFSRRFLEWARQIETSAGTGLFRLDEEPSPESLGLISKGGELSPDSFHQLMARMNRTHRSSLGNPVGRYFHTLSQAVDAFCSSQYSSWWGQHV